MGCESNYEYLCFSVSLFLPLYLCLCFFIPVSLSLPLCLSACVSVFLCFWACIHRVCLFSVGVYCTHHVFSLYSACVSIQRGRLLYSPCVQPVFSMGVRLATLGLLEPSQQQWV